MADNEMKQSEGSCCGSKSGGRCCGKYIVALVLLLVGGLIGYMCGKCCSAGKGAMCPVAGMSAPATPAK